MSGRVLLSVMVGGRGQLDGGGVGRQLGEGSLGVSVAALFQHLLHTCTTGYNQNTLN